MNPFHAKAVRKARRQATTLLNTLGYIGDANMQTLIKHLDEFLFETEWARQPIRASKPLIEATKPYLP